jgi:SepF-like predicted cell division protein (DUF552 family)
MVMKQLKGLFDKVKASGKGAPSKPKTDMMKIDMKEDVSDKEPLALQVIKLESFADTEGILESLRSGKRIMLVKITALKEKDMTELKRAINRFKTHCAATGSDLAAIDDSWIILVPPVVGLERM